MEAACRVRERCLWPQEDQPLQPFLGAASLEPETDRSEPLSLVKLFSSLDIPVDIFRPC